MISSKHHPDNQDIKIDNKYVVFCVKKIHKDNL